MRQFFRVISFLIVVLINWSTFANECFETGTTKEIPFFYNGKFNKDRTMILKNFEGESDKFLVLNVKSGAITEHKKKLDEYPSWTADGKVSLYTYPDNESHDIRVLLESSPTKYLNYLKKIKIRTIDPKTKKVKVLDGKIEDFKTGEFYSIVSVEKTKEVSHIVLTDKKGKNFKETILPRKNSLLNDVSSQIEITLDGDKLKVFGGRNELLFNIPFSAPDEVYKNLLLQSHEQTVESSFFEKQQKGFIKVNKPTVEVHEQLGNKYIVVDLNTKSQLPIDTGIHTIQGHDPRNLSQNGQRVLLFSGTGTNFYDLKNKKVKLLSKDYLGNAHFDEKDNICGLNSDTDLRPAIFYECYNPETNEKLSSQFVTRDNSGYIEILSPKEFIITPGSYNASSPNDLIAMEEKHKSYINKASKSCPEKMPFEDCKCDRKLTPQINVQDLRKIELNLACSEKFNENNWRSLTPESPEHLTEENSLFWLKRFSKPSGFSVNHHLPILQAMLKEELFYKYPENFKEALNGILLASPALFEDILYKHPILQDRSFKKYAVSKSCLTEEEKLAVSHAMKNYLKYLLNSSTSYVTQRDQLLYSLAKDSLVEAEKEELAEKIADQAIELLGRTELNGIFPSKVYKLAYNKAKSELGLPFKDLTDITINRADGELSLLTLSMNPIEGSTPTLKGIHFAVKEKLPENQIQMGITSKKYSWDYNGKKYHAEIEFDKETVLKDLAPAHPSPSYKEMKKKNQYNGLIVVGTNLGKSSTDNVVQEYLEYFSQEGFKFSEAEVENDFLSLLKERISGENPAHYFVKEAHSDGDEKNLFRINKKGKVLRGTKIKNGIKETIEIVYPGSDNTSELLSNEEFGKWMQAREAGNKPELVYLNSSCWSVSKAVFEITSAKTTKLINIPTTTSMQTFTNSETNVMFAAIDGLRKEKSYAEIREAMKKNPKYKNGTDNIMIFPDEDLYKTTIKDKIKIPISINTKMYVEQNGVKTPYSIEE